MGKDMGKDFEANLQSEKSDVAATEGEGGAKPDKEDSSISSEDDNGDLSPGE